MLPAYQAFAWFCLTTRAHENHWFFALPLAALSLPTGRPMRLVFTAISFTGLNNLILHDPHLLPQLKGFISERCLFWMQIVNSAANLGILAAWTLWLVRSRRDSMAVRALGVAS
jgi:hypothetical protein